MSTYKNKVISINIRNKIFTSGYIGLKELSEACRSFDHIDLLQSLNLLLKQNEGKILNILSNLKYPYFKRAIKLLPEEEKQKIIIKVLKHQYIQKQAKEKISYLLEIIQEESLKDLLGRENAPYIFNFIYSNIDSSTFLHLLLKNFSMSEEDSYGLFLCIFTSNPNFADNIYKELIDDTYKLERFIDLYKLTNLLPYVSTDLIIDSLKNNINSFELIAIELNREPDQYFTFFDLLVTDMENDTDKINLLQHINNITLIIKILNNIDDYRNINEESKQKIIKEFSSLSAETQSISLACCIPSLGTYLLYLLKPELTHKIIQQSNPAIMLNLLRNMDTDFIYSFLKEHNLSISILQNTDQQNIHNTSYISPILKFLNNFIEQEKEKLENINKTNTLLKQLVPEKNEFFQLTNKNIFIIQELNNAIKGLINNIKMSAFILSEKQNFIELNIISKVIIDNLNIIKKYDPLITDILLPSILIHCSSENFITALNNLSPKEIISIFKIYENESENILKTIFSNIMSDNFINLLKEKLGEKHTEYHNIAYSVMEDSFNNSDPEKKQDFLVILAKHFPEKLQQFFTKKRIALVTLPYSFTTQIKSFDLNTQDVLFNNITNNIDDFMTFINNNTYSETYNALLSFAEKKITEGYLEKGKNYYSTPEYIFYTRRINIILEEMLNRLNGSKMPSAIDTLGVHYKLALKFIPGFKNIMQNIANKNNILSGAANIIIHRIDELRKNSNNLPDPNEHPEMKDAA